MKFDIRRIIGVLVGMAIAMAFVAADMSAPLAQTYPVANPTYIPTAVGPSQTLTTAVASTAMQANNLGTVYLRVAGTNSGLVATVQGTESRAASPTYTSIGVDQVGVGRVATIVGNGLYRIRAAGFAQLRLNVTALTSGTAILTWSGTSAVIDTIKLNAQRPTYSATITALTPASSPTDLVTIIGSATATIRIKEVRCNGLSTAAATAVVSLVKRSTADTSGTSTTLTDVPHDNNDPAGTAVVKAYTVNPTLGTTVGTIRSGLLTTNTAASSAFQSTPLEWIFGRDADQEIVLRGVTDQVALNGLATSLTSGASLNCSIEWTEE